MTIIAYRNGVMASDSCWSDGQGDENIYAGLIFAKESKVRKLESGALYGASGASDDRELLGLINKVTIPQALPSARALQECEHSNVTALLVLPDRSVWRIYTGEENGGIEPVTGFPYAATGSGSALAIGAMLFGASAEEAAHVACVHNVYCRPPIHTVTF